MKSKQWSMKAENVVKHLADKASEASGVAVRELERSGIKDKVLKAAQSSKQFLDESGVTQRVNIASDVVGSHLDTVAGVTQLRLVEERLELQAKYNDILAEKLEEALQRISKLEALLTAE